jgi:hypothetical protein
MDSGISLAIIAFLMVGTRVVGWIFVRLHKGAKFLSYYKSISYKVS